MFWMLEVFFLDGRAKSVYVLILLIYGTFSNSSSVTQNTNFEPLPKRV